MKRAKHLSGMARIAASAMTAVLMAGMIFSAPFNMLPGLADEDLKAQYEALSAQDLEDQLSSVQDEAEAQELLLSQLQEEILSLNSEMLRISAELEETAGLIAEKNVEIEATRVSLAEAQELSDEQYESMKLRIQYMYENQDNDMISLLFGGGSISEVLSAVEYMTQITGYDREKLREYQGTQEEIAAEEAVLAGQLEELKRLEEQLLTRQEETERCIQTIQSNVSICTELLAGYQSDMDNIGDQIAFREELRERMEESLSVEASQSMEASIQASIEASVEASIQQSIEESIEESVEASIEAEQDESNDNPEQSGEGAGSTPEGGGSGNSSELDMLAAIIYCEARGEGYEGKVGVGNVVLNRMESHLFPNTMLEVLYQNNQFAPVFTGTYAVALAFGLADETCYQAAQDALDGVNTVGDCLYFKSVSGADPDKGVIIGNIYFY